MTRRIERAMALLRRGDLNVTEVCFAVGRSLQASSTSTFRAGGRVRHADARAALAAIYNRVTVEAYPPEP